MASSRLSSLLRGCKANTQALFDDVASPHPSVRRGASVNDGGLEEDHDQHGCLLLIAIFGNFLE